MKWILLCSYLAIIPLAAAKTQSLAELSRLELERRQKIEQQGVPAKRIEYVGRSDRVTGGTVSTSSPVAGKTSRAEPAAKADPRPALRTFQARLQKLDRDIAQAEDRVKVLRKKIEAERWAPIKTAKGSLGLGSSAAVDQLRWQVTELEGKIAALRRERGDVFQAGRKAGYLPGELENRGILR